MRLSATKVAEGASELAARYRIPEPGQHNEDKLPKHGGHVAITTLFSGDHRVFDLLQTGSGIACVACGQRRRELQPCDYERVSGLVRAHLPHSRTVVVEFGVPRAVRHRQLPPPAPRDVGER